MSEITHAGVTYITSGIRIGNAVEICYKPRIAGHIVGFDELQNNWLAELDVPYGANSGVYSVLPEKMLAYMDAKKQP